MRLRTTETHAETSDAHPEAAGHVETAGTATSAGTGASAGPARRWLRALRGTDERGMTLTEMLITVVILGLIMVPLANAMIGFIRLTDDTTQRLNESHDIQTAAAYFAQDVRGLGTRDWAAFPYPLKQSIEVAAPARSGLYPCGAVGTPDAVVRLASDDPPSALVTPAVASVSYVEITVGAERQLHRISCASATATPTDIVVVHNLAATPVLTCSSACTGVGSAVPGTVTLTVSIKDPASTATPVTVALTGQRRQT